MADIENQELFELNEEALSEVTGGKGNKYVMATAEANVRKGPGKNYDIIGTAREGRFARYTGNSVLDKTGRVWHEVSVGGRKGWINGKYSKIF